MHKTVHYVGRRAASVFCLLVRARSTLLRLAAAAALLALCCVVGSAAAPAPAPAAPPRDREVDPTLTLLEVIIVSGAVCPDAASTLTRLPAPADPSRSLRCSSEHTVYVQ